MPIYDYLCMDCGEVCEMLVTSSDASPECTACGGQELKKMMSAHSSLSGASGSKIPAAGDTACCGTSPAEATCAGPGSCCGKFQG